MLEFALACAMSQGTAAVTHALLATAAGCYLASLWGKVFSEHRYLRCGEDD